MGLTAIKTFSATSQCYNVCHHICYLFRRKCATLNRHSQFSIFREQWAKCSSDGFISYGNKDSCQVHPLSASSSLHVHGVHQFSCGLLQRNNVRLNNLISQVLMSQECVLSPTLMSKSNLNSGAVTSRYYNMEIQKNKYFHLRADFIHPLQDKNYLFLRKYCTLLNECSAFQRTVKQEQIIVRKRTTLHMQEAKCLNAWIPLLGCSLLLNMSYVTLYCGQPSVCTQHRRYSIKRKNYKFPELKPEDLEEMFVRGSGPGGQSVNKTTNCVVLKHKLSGIVIKCHETRSLFENRKLARQRLEEKLDLHLHGDQSYLSQLKSESREEKSEMNRRAKIRLALKKAFKDRENLD